MENIKVVTWNPWGYPIKLRRRMTPKGVAWTTVLTGKDRIFIVRGETMRELKQTIMKERESMMLMKNNPSD